MSVDLSDPKISHNPVPYEEFDLSRHPNAH